MSGCLGWSLVGPGHFSVKESLRYFSSQGADSIGRGRCVSGRTRAPSTPSRAALSTPLFAAFQDVLKGGANFHEKALFVKVDVATPSCASATALCPSLCFHPHF
jgi:hypothetical protein